MKKKIKLGSVVRDIYTGFTGVAMHRTEFINGCVQYGVMPPCKNNKIADEVGIDSGSLEMVESPKRKPAKKKEKRTGGPMTAGVRMRGY